MEKILNYVKIVQSVITPQLMFSVFLVSLVIILLVPAFPFLNFVYLSSAVSATFLICSGLELITRKVRLNRKIRKIVPLLGLQEVHMLAKFFSNDSITIKVHRAELWEESTIKLLHNIGIIEAICTSEGKICSGISGKDISAIMSQPWYDYVADNLCQIPELKEIIQDLQDIKRRNEEYKQKKAK